MISNMFSVDMAFPNGGLAVDINNFCSAIQEIRTAVPPG